MKFLTWLVFWAGVAPSCLSKSITKLRAIPKLVDQGIGLHLAAAGTALGMLNQGEHSKTVLGGVACSATELTVFQSARITDSVHW